MKLKSKYHKKLNSKFFEPFYITNTTILQFQNQQNAAKDKELKLSIIDIISQFFIKNKSS